MIQVGPSVTITSRIAWSCSTRFGVQVGDHDRVFAIADEDPEHETEEKTSSVHFLRFELTPAMIESAKAREPIRVGADHENYRHGVELEPASRDSLTQDLAV